MSEIKKIVFITGSMADFGKIKPLIIETENDKQFETGVFVTGMHLSEKYGNTQWEVNKTVKNIFTFDNGAEFSAMDQILSKTIDGFSLYLKAAKPDLIVVHGDRVEALAGAIVGSLNNILVAHIEGGEISGTVDEHIRHAVSKMSHIHFVANQDAAERLFKMGESKERVYVIGSPDIDIMISNKLPTIEETKERYNIKFKKYAVLIHHPVTTELGKIESEINMITKCLINSKFNYVVIYPNNDHGSEIIFNVYDSSISKNKHFRIFDSMRFEYFLTLLKHSHFIIGNSSTGVREAPIYGVPSIIVGTRQLGRMNGISYGGFFQSVSGNEKKVYSFIQKLSKKLNRLHPVVAFGDGKSVKRFLEIIKSDKLWSTGIQKIFSDYGNNISISQIKRI